MGFFDPCDQFMVSTTSLHVFFVLCPVDGENRFAIVTNDMAARSMKSREGYWPAHSSIWVRPSHLFGVRHSPRRATLNGPGCPRGRLLRRTVLLLGLVTEHRFELTPVEPCASNDVPLVRCSWRVRRAMLFRVPRDTSAPTSTAAHHVPAVGRGPSRSDSRCPRSVPPGRNGRPRP